MSKVVREVTMRRRIEQLEYTSAMIAELKGTAAADGEKTLAYLLEMAYVEACDRRRTLHHQRRDVA